MNFGVSIVNIRKAYFCLSTIVLFELCSILIRTISPVPMNVNYFSEFTLFCLLSSGDVRVNWTPTTKNGVTLKSGDVVSVSGMGRLKVI